jgi:hypothetical protein
MSVFVFVRNDDNNIFMKILSIFHIQHEMIWPFSVFLFNLKGIIPKHIISFRFSTTPTAPLGTMAAYCWAVQKLGRNMQFALAHRSRAGLVMHSWVQALHYNPAISQNATIRYLSDNDPLVQCLQTGASIDHKFRELLNCFRSKRSEAQVLSGCNSVAIWSGVTTRPSMQSCKSLWYDEWIRRRRWLTKLYDGTMTIQFVILVNSFVVSCWKAASKYCCRYCPTSNFTPVSGTNTLPH